MGSPPLLADRGAARKAAAASLREAGAPRGRKTPVIDPKWTKTSAFAFPPKRIEHPQRRLEPAPVSVRRNLGGKNMNQPNVSVNAWVYLNEDEPSGSTYKTPGSSYQSLIDHGVYKNVDMVNMCFVEIVPTGPDTVPAGDGSSFTLQMGAFAHNQQYMLWMIEDARKANPNIKLLLTLLWGNADTLTQIFTGDPSQWQQDAERFASNLVAYLDHYGLDGFDVDWEYPISDQGTQQQFAILFTGVGGRARSRHRQCGLRFRQPAALFRLHHARGVHQRRHFGGPPRLRRQVRVERPDGAAGL
jgi:hypothetical protein